MAISAKLVGLIKNIYTVMAASLLRDEHM